MTLYDWLKLNDGCYDTYDLVYDGVVTVDYIENEEEFYDKFCMGMARKIEFVNTVKGSSCEIVCNWTKFIRDNIEIFREFTEENWTHQYEDDIDEFIYQWIKEIHYWMAGYVSENTYKDFIENYMSRMN